MVVGLFIRYRVPAEVETPQETPHLQFFTNRHIAHPHDDAAVHCGFADPEPASIPEPTPECAPEVIVSFKDEQERSRWRSRSRSRSRTPSPNTTITDTTDQPAVPSPATVSVPIPSTSPTSSPIYLPKSRRISHMAAVSRARHHFRNVVLGLAVPLAA